MKNYIANPGLRVLSDAIFYRTYSAPKKDGTKETWEETVRRYEHMMLERAPKSLEFKVRAACDLIRKKILMPSMRMLQFSGNAVKRENARGYNCTFFPIDSVKSFSELCYLSMCGCGCGYSVQKEHIQALNKEVDELRRVYMKTPEDIEAKLPNITASENGYIIHDSKEGWSDAWAMLVINPNSTFDYSQLRPAGAIVSTGGTSSGPEPLINAINIAREILQQSFHITTLMAYDVLGLIASCVVAGGVRRTATSTIFSPDDTDLLEAKKNFSWDGPHDWRGFSNISVALDPETTTEKEFKSIIDTCYENNSGEPGVVWLKDKLNWGFNPCFEIALENFQMCNLCEIVSPAVKRWADDLGMDTHNAFIRVSEAAALLGTLQASFTSFNYLRPIWKERVEKAALLGVSITGTAMYTPGNYTKQACARRIIEMNAIFAKELGINPTERATCQKPSGSTSIVVGTTSGIHAGYSKYYMRRVTLGKDLPLTQKLIKTYGTSYPGSKYILEEISSDPNNVFLCVPVMMDSNYFADTEDPIGLLERAKEMRLNWIEAGHVKGDNKHNVSLTVNYDAEDTNKKEEIKDWMWENKKNYSGISLFPKFSSLGDQLPLQAITEEEYKDIMNYFPDDIEEIIKNSASMDYSEVNDARRGEAACSGGNCELF